MSRRQSLSAADHVVPDVVIQQHIRLVSAAKEVLDTANGEYRSTLKSAKSAGINQQQLTKALADAKRDPEQIKLDDRDFQRYRALLHMPVHQLDLFGSSSDAPPTDPSLLDAEPGDHELWEAVEAGKVSGSTGGDQMANPHTHPALAKSWLKGFKLGLKLIADRMGQGATVAPTRKRRERDGAQATLDS